MDYSGKKEMTEQLRAQANKLRQWMMEHTSPDTGADEFCEVAGRYAILCTRIYLVEKQW